jgi:cytoskeleton protein RodZ
MSDVSQDLSAGTMLRRAREAAGLHVAALAVSIKVPVKKLEALEADQLDTMMDAVFVRALACSVCRALKMDPAPVLDKLPQNRAPRLHRGELGINAPFHAPGQTPGLFVPASFAKPGFIAVLALLVGAAALVLLPEIKTPEHLTLGEKVETAPVAQVPAAATLPAEQNTSVSGAAADAPVALADAGAVPEAVGASAAVPTLGAETLPAVTTGSTSAPAAAAVEAKPPLLQTGVVVFRAKGASWVEVVDAKAVVQLRKLFAAGDVGAAGGSLPLSVVVGRADAMDVEVRGKPFDFTSVSKDGVARFEVK